LEARNYAGSIDLLQGKRNGPKGRKIDVDNDDDDDDDDDDDNDDYGIGL
jgi:hypothetical protein